MRRIFIDCPQEIPCNPCMSICKVGAIVVEHLTERPQFYPEKCIGCENCVAGCSGQACFLIDEDYSKDEATIDFAFEFLPLPVIGEEREAKDNEGNTVCLGRVVNVLSRKGWSGTKVVRLAVPKKLVYKVRGMARKPLDNQEG